MQVEKGGEVIVGETASKEVGVEGIDHVREHLLSI
jgi:hypothetical protein